MKSSVEKGDASELAVCGKLLSVGFRDVRMTPRGAPYDLEVDGYPVEVKFASRSKSGHWTFQVQAHKGAPFPVLGYVLCAARSKRPNDWTYIVYPGPIHIYSIRISAAYLDGQNGGMVENWEALKIKPYALSPNPAPKRLLTEFMAINGGYAQTSKCIEYALMARPRWSAKELAVAAGHSEDRVNKMIRGIIRPDARLMYALGMRIPKDYVKTAEQSAAMIARGRQNAAKAKAIDYRAA